MGPIKILRENTFILGIYQPNQQNNVQLIGTVSAISDKDFIGTLHCIKKWPGNQYVAINPNTKEDYFLEVKEVNENRDLVIFNAVNDKISNWIKKSNILPKQEDKIYIYGYPKEDTSISEYKGSLIQARCKLIGNLKEVPLLGKVLIFDQKILGNHSGSPILDKQGLLIGVAKSEIINIPKFKEFSLGVCLIE